MIVRGFVYDVFVVICVIMIVILIQNVFMRARENTPTLVKSLFYLTLIRKIDTLAITLGNYKGLRSLSKQPNHNRMCRLVKSYL